MGEREMMTFAWPWMGLLLLLPVAVHYLMPAAKRQAAIPIVRFPHLEALRRSFSAFTPSSQHGGRWFLALVSLIWLCLTLALMRPQIVDQMTEVKNEGYDIMLAVDLSGSMRALDFSQGNQRVDRLDVAKKVVGDFVRDRKDDRVGLILFGDFAYQYAPLTLDTDAVGKMLNETVISMAGDGTAIGDALGLAVKGLRDRPETSRIIILLTDGEDTASSIPPVQAAQLAADYGIKIYTIGIGSKGRVPFPNRAGRIMWVETNMDEELLRAIAEHTGGAYFRATDSNALKQVYEQINRLEKSESETRQYLIRTPLYRYPLGAALGLLVLLALLPLGGQVMQRYGGRYGV